MTRLTKRDKKVIQLTWASLANALGWDKNYPETLLHSAVRARFDNETYTYIGLCDAALAGKLENEQ